MDIAERPVAPPSSELACPACGSAMVRRRRRSDGAAFWGCPRFPECRGTRDLAAIRAVRPDAPGPTLSAASWDDPGWRGVPGASAQRMFDRRRAGHRVRLDRERPRIAAGGAAVAGFAVAVGLAVPGWQVPGALFAVLAVIVTIGRLTVLPQSVQAWETGADGERRTADALAPLAARGFAILHDRLIPGSPANIDHIVVGPTGVHVVESKRSGGRVEVRSGDLFVRGRRRTAWIDQVEREAGAVSAALGGAPVGRLICVHGADLPLFSRPTIRGVRIVDARGLVRALTEGSTTLTPADVERSGALCATRLLPAGAVRDEAASADR